MRLSSGPVHVSAALSELILLRGFARVGGLSELNSAWSAVAGSEIDKHTKVRVIKRGVLQVDVDSSALLSELTCFHRSSLLQQLQADHAELKITNLRFRLNSDAGG